MQVMPTVLILLTVLGFISFSLIQTFSFSHVEAKHFTAHMNAHTNRLSRLQKKLFEALPRSETEKRSYTKAERKNVFFPRTQRDVYQPVYLGVLKKTAAKPELKAFAKRYFKTLYKTVTFDGNPITDEHLGTLFDTLIKTKLDLKTLEDDPYGRKILKGTHRVDLSKPKGYPAFFEVFSLEEKEAPIPFRGIPKELLPLLFSEKQITLLSDEESKKSTRANRACTLNEKEFNELFPVKTQLMNMFYFETRQGSERVSDKDNIVELLLHGNANSNEVPSPSTDETDSVKL